VGDNTEVTNVRLLHNAGNYLQKNSLNKKCCLPCLKGYTQRVRILPISCAKSELAWWKIYYFQET